MRHSSPAPSRCHYTAELAGRQRGKLSVGNVGRVARIGSIIGTLSPQCPIKHIFGVMIASERQRQADGAEGLEASLSRSGTLRAAPAISNSSRLRFAHLRTFLQLPFSLGTEPSHQILFLKFATFCLPRYNLSWSWASPLGFSECSTRV